MQPIAKQRIDNSVYEQLLNNIKSGVWKHGEKLPSEGQLCDILQVSRVSIRSALQRLQALGFIEVKRAKGSFVCSREELFDFSNFDDTINLTEKEFHDIAQLREMIEMASIKILIALGDRADLAQISEACQGMEEAVRTLDFNAFTQNDHKFHMSVILATGNEKFIQIAQINREDFFRYLYESNKFMLRDRNDVVKFRSHFEESLVWHTELHEALVNRDESSEEIQKRHMARNIERLAFYYQDKAGAKGKSARGTRLQSTATV